MKKVVLELLKSQLAEDGTLTGDNLGHIEEAILKALTMEGDLSPDAVQRARKQLREHLDQLKGKNIAAVSAESMRVAIKSALDLLDQMPEAMMGLAQSVDVPSHIFDLGAARGSLLTARHELECAARALEHFIECCAEDALAKPATQETQPA